MGYLAKAFFRGLAAIVPVLATIYILWWFLEGTESLLKEYLVQGDEISNVYFPGLGIALGIVVTLIVGVLLSNWLIRWIHDSGISLLERVPLVKTIYRMLKDMVMFFGHSDDNAFSQVAMVRPVKGGPEMIGFVTQSTWEGMPDGMGGPDKVGVYLPMSYQIGGFLVVIDKENVRPIEMEMEEALRIALSAGITSKRDEPRLEAPA